MPLIDPGRVREEHGIGPFGVVEQPVELDAPTLVERDLAGDLVEHLDRGR